MRCLAGVTTPTSGTAKINGTFIQNLPNPAATIGTLLDASAFHPGRTGLEILKLAAISLGVDKRRIGEVTEMIGLSRQQMKQRVKTYSLGMRQRLGIGFALIGSPKVLVLDEPANGLDPQGIWWMRNLLRSFADEGGTVLLSSHLLHEVEQIADRLIIISHGRIMVDDSMATLKQSGESLEDMFFRLTMDTPQLTNPTF